MDPVLIPIIGVSIPLVAIAGSYFLKWQKMKMEQLDKSIPRKEIVQLTEKVQKLADENDRLKQRLENVEVIVADESFHVALPPKDESENLQAQIDKLVARKELLKANKKS